MVLPIVKYGHPVLRQRGAKVEAVTPDIQQLIADMLDTMKAARGVGLAAQQVGRALMLTVLDVREATDRPSVMSIDGQPVDPAAHMPMVLINPEIKPVGTPVPGPEGCLSFPEIYADIIRPESVEVRATAPDGKQVAFWAGGLLGRAVQHEVDHLKGILFIDRMSSDKKRELQVELDDLQSETKAFLASPPTPGKPS